MELYYNMHTISLPIIVDTKSGIATLNASVKWWLVNSHAHAQSVAYINDNQVCLHFNYMYGKRSEILMNMYNIYTDVSNFFDAIYIYMVNN